MTPHPPRKRFAGLAILFLSFLLASPIGAATINDGTASVTVSDANGSWTNYTLGGQDHLFQADYYFRTGSMTAEDMMTGVNSTYVNSVTQSGLEITVTGSTTEFDFTLLYRLDGEGRMIPTLTVTNTTASQLDVELFNYQDWDVNGSAGGDTITWNGSVVRVTEGATIITVTPFQSPDAVEASGWPALRNSLRNGSPTTLNDGAGLPFGPGDGTFAFQFSISLNPGQSTSVIYTVPEPETGLLGLMGLAGLAWSSRRRRPEA